MKQYIVDDGVLNKINKFHRKSDIRSAKIAIGKIRIEAEKNNGYVKKYLHKKANYFDNKLNRIIG